ncbi:hypothetical protein C8R43DRAFT_1029228 [Mycena crocata]|nr:hypothetical protein C8R43DRAFT_1029228 [Mycena crocata]
MVTTRKQAKDEEAADSHSKRPAPHDSNSDPGTGEQGVADTQDSEDTEPPTKKVKKETGDTGSPQVREEGTTERGHVYFFFRPRVETTDPSSIDDVKNLHMLLVPQPPAFSMGHNVAKGRDVESEEMDMELLRLVTTRFSGLMGTVDQLENSSTAEPAGLARRVFW